LAKIILNRKYQTWAMFVENMDRQALFAHRLSEFPNKFNIKSYLSVSESNQNISRALNPDYLQNVFAATLLTGIHESYFLAESQPLYLEHNQQLYPLVSNYSFPFVSHCMWLKWAKNNAFDPDMGVYDNLFKYLQGHQKICQPTTFQNYITRLNSLHGETEKIFTQLMGSINLDSGQWQANMDCLHELIKTWCQ
jgi:hypothetical protein